MATSIPIYAAHSQRVIAYARIDADDYERVAGHRWVMQGQPDAPTFVYRYRNRREREAHERQTIGLAQDLLGHPGRITLRIVQPSPACVAVEVSDNGVGIQREHLTRIFEHGFTTKPDGHGFGLHSSALAAKELGGTLTASSEGSGCGATFRLELPLQTEGKNTCVQAIIVDNDVS